MIIVTAKDAEQQRSKHVSEHPKSHLEFSFYHINKLYLFFSPYFVGPICNNGVFTLILYIQLWYISALRVTKEEKIKEHRETPYRQKAHKPHLSSVLSHRA